MFCSKSEACHCWTVSERIKLTKEPDFEQFCQQNYFVDDNNKEKDTNDYFSDDELPPNETNEVADEWLDSHLMDDTSTIASDKSSRKSGNDAIPDNVDANADSDPEDNEEMVKEVDHNFLVDDYVGQVNKDSIEAPAELPGLLSINSTNIVKATKSSGDEPPYNHWLEFRGKNKAPLQLSEILCAKLETVFPIIFCSDPENQFDNNCYWEPCILKKVGHELYEVLDANEDLKLLEQELEYTRKEGLRYLWGLVYKHPSMAFISTFQKKLLTSGEGNENKKDTQPVTTACSCRMRMG